MSNGGMSKARLSRMHDLMAGYIERGEVPGIVTLVSNRMGQARPGSPWQKRESEIELRQLFELDDFAPSQAIGNARKLEKELAKKK
jgi:hypothetical protein